MTTPIRLVLIDDHPVVREGLRRMLAAQADFDIVGVAENGQAGVELVATLQPDVALMDLRMPVLDGVGAIREIKRRKLATHVLVLTTFDSDSDIVKAVEAGATGYLLKDAPRDELFRAIRSAAQGQTVLTPKVASRLITRMREPVQETLSQREVEVLALVKDGLTNKEIGRKLHISTATVKTHLIHVFDKLDVSDRTAAVTVALERGILSLG